MRLAREGWPQLEERLSGLKTWKGGKSSDEPDYCYRAELDRVVDGDTLDVLIDLGFYIKIKERIRLEGEVSQLVSWIVGSLGVGWDTLLIYRTCGNLCTNLLSLEGRGFTP